MTGNAVTAAQTTPTAKPPKKRLALKIVAIALAAVIVLLALAPYILPTAWLASAVETAVKSHVRGPVTLGGVSWGWLGGVTVDGVAIGETSEFGGGTFLKVSRISVQVSFLDLLWKKVTVKSVTIDSPEITITRNEQGAWNYENLFAGQDQTHRFARASVAPAPAGGSFDVAVHKVRVEKGVLDFQDHKENISLKATDLSASVDADYSGDMIRGGAKVSFDLAQPQGNGRFELVAENVSAPNPPSAGAIDKAVASGTIMLTGIDIGEAIATSAPQFKHDLATGRLTLAIDYDLASGVVKLKGRNGSISGLALGKAAGMPASTAIGDVKFTFDAAGSQDPQQNITATLNSFALTTAFLDLDASGKANITQQAKSVSAKASGSIDPSALPKGLVQLPPDIETAGRAKFDVSFEGNPAPGKFAATVDAGPMKVALANVLKKESGVAAAVAVSGQMSPTLITADKFDVTLNGGAITGSGSFDPANKAAAWTVSGNFKGLNVADYYPGSRPLTVAGAFTDTGKFFLASQKRASDFVVDTTFDKLSLDVPENPGTEVILSGATSFNSVRATATGLTLNVGGMPISIEMNITAPLERPAGTVTVRGRQIDADSLLAVARALQSSVPSAPAAEAESAAAPASRPASEIAQAAGRSYITSANVNLDLKIDQMIYQNFTGTNLVVDAGLVSGNAVVRRASVDIFGGNAGLTYNGNLLSSDMPFQMDFKAANVQANDATQQYIAKWLPGMQVNGTVAATFAATGKLGGSSDQMQKSMNGRGELDLTDSTLGFGDMPEALSALLGGLNLDAVRVASQSIPLELADGALSSDYTAPTGAYELFVTGKTYLAGGYSQKIGVSPRGSNARIRLLTIESGKRSYVDAKDLMADLVSAGLSGAFLKQPSVKGSEQPTKEEQAVQGVESLINLFGGEKEKPKAPSKTPSKKKK